MRPIKGNGDMHKNSSHPARRALQFREAFFSTVTPDDVQSVISALLQKAKGGDLAAARWLLDRCLGTETLERWNSERDVAEAETFDRIARFGS